MFATVELYEGDKSLKNKLRRILIKDKITAERVLLPENEYFYKLRVPIHKGKIPAEKLFKAASSMTDGLIFQDGVAPCDGIKVFSSSYFKRLLLFNSAVSYLKQGQAEPQDTLITLIDEGGVLHTHTDTLISLAGEIKIITQNKRAYESTAQRLMREYGASLFISERLSAIPHKGIIISLHSHIIPLHFKGLLITGEKRFLPFARVLTGEGIKGREKYKSLCPPGIDLTEFLAALCEACYVKELRESEYEKLVDI